MRLNSSMKYLTQNIEYGAKKRKESVSSMINSYKKKRINEGIEDRTARILYVAKLKSDVRNLLLNDFNKRKTMNFNRRQSFDFFMNNLKSSTAKLLSIYREKQNLIAVDVLGARAEWDGSVQLQKISVDTSNNENSEKCSIDSDYNTDNNENSDNGLCGPDCNTDNNENSDNGLCGPDCNADMLQLSEEVNKSESSSDIILLNSSIQTGNNNDIVNQDTTVKEEIIQQNDCIESRVIDFIKESKEGKKLVEIREFITSFDENNNVQELLFKMCNNGILKKFRYRYYIINSNLK